MLKTVDQVLKDLIETLEDGKKGFQEAAERLDDGRADIANRLRGFADQRQRFSAQLRRLAGERGIQIDEGGSLAGAVHRGWIAVKDAMAGDAHAVLSAAESGEDHAVAEFESALDEGDLPSDIREVVAGQAAAVKETHDAVRNMRDREGA